MSRRWTGALAACLIALPAPAAAFSGSRTHQLTLFPFSYQPNGAHHRITQDADRAVTSALAGRGYVSPSDDRNGIYKVIDGVDGLEFAIGSERLQQGIPFAGVSAALNEKRRFIVTTGAYMPEHHFFRDGRVEGSAVLPSSKDAFDKSRRGWLRLLDAAAAALGEGRPREAAVALGVALHAGQDLWSHSNLAELSLGRVAPDAKPKGWGKGKKALRAQVEARNAAQAKVEQAAAAKVVACMDPARVVPCDVPDELELTWFPVEEPTRSRMPARLAPERGKGPGGLDCAAGPLDCYEPPYAESTWRRHVAAVCEAARGDLASDSARWANTCYGKERIDLLLPTNYRWEHRAAFRAAYDGARALTELTLTWLFERSLEFDPPDNPTARGRTWAKLAAVSFDDRGTP